jgi:IS5 family transposase
VVSELWNDKPHKKSHKDVDARWTEKRGEKFYGYKMHAKADQRHKMVLKYDTTSANVHDSKGYEPLLDKSDEGKELYLDAGYESQEPIVEKHRMKPVICEKGHRNHPLTDEQKKKNREKSKTRCLVEHVFGFMEQSMCGLIFRRVGMLRARADVAMTCIVYNICRYTQIMRLNPVSIAYNRN